MSEPTHIGPFRLVESIGKGGMAQVYRGQWLGAGRTVMAVALKVMREEAAANPKAREMFTEEARISGYLSHANICRVYPTAVSANQPYIAMEWINGLDLAGLNHRLRIVRQELSYDLISYIIHCILLALKAAHTFVLDGKPHPIIHRDVSPQNVMLSVRGEVKLMDFGIARVLVDQTSPFEYAGKLRYSPLEQLLGRVSPATDLYAVGAVLHELVEGSLFRADFQSSEAMQRAIEQGYVPILTRPNIPAALKALHAALLRPKAEDRPQTASAALRILGPVMAAQEELAALVSRQLGDRARMSGSTQGDFPVPEAVAAIADPPSPGRHRQDLGTVPGEQIDRGEMAHRTPTARLGKRGASRRQRSDVDGVPVRRRRPRAEWVKIPGGSAEASAPRTLRPSTRNNVDAVPVAVDVVPHSDAIESTDPSSSPGAPARWKSTEPARRVAAAGSSRSPWWWVAATVVVGPLAGAGLYFGGSNSADPSATISYPGEGESDAAVVSSSSTDAAVLEVEVEGIWTRVGRGHVDLPAGHYRVRWRTPEAAQWQHSRVTIEDGVVYELTVREGSLDVRGEPARDSR